MWKPDFTEVDKVGQDHRVVSDFNRPGFKT